MIIQIPYAHVLNENICIHKMQTGLYLGMNPLFLYAFHFIHLMNHMSIESWWSVLSLTSTSNLE